MPLISPHNQNPLIDGRQSPRALRVRRGVQTLLTEMGAAHIPELTLANGRRADLTAIFNDGSIWIIEIKSSIEDIRSDAKWPDYREYCDQLYFATLPDVPRALFPEDCGFICADQHSAEILRTSPISKMQSPRRKAVMLRFAQFAAAKLLQAELCSFTTGPAS
ncbi:MAG: MmcB family DNA repair protein [Ahrensia sp.]|nr:MmcB family DNA repair protein [Ahrensia sp.]